MSTGLWAQTTSIEVTGTVKQNSVKRLGINLGDQTYYDSGQMLKNLIFRNPGFEGMIYQSTMRAATGTSTTFTDENNYAAWPAGFWNGATYEIFYGAAKGRSGTITSSTAPNPNVSGLGVVLTLNSSGTAPKNGDYILVKKSFTGGADAGWWTSTSGGATIGTEFSDLPSPTDGKQAIRLTAANSGQSLTLTSYFDSMQGISFVQMNGTFQLSFKAKSVSGNNKLSVNVARLAPAGITYLDQTVTLTNSWQTYNLTFKAAETGSAVGTAQVQFGVSGGTVLMDDVAMQQTDGDSSNTSAFRDSVVNTLRTLKPGVLRYMASGTEMGDSIDNTIAPVFGRVRPGYSAWSSLQEDIPFGLVEFLNLCELVGAEPFYTFPISATATDFQHLIEFLAGPTTSTYGAKRAARGHSTPYTQVFKQIHLEFGNEVWNSTFKGASIEYSDPQGQRTAAVFSAGKQSPYYEASKFDFVIGGQAVSPGRNQETLQASGSYDTLSLAPYLQLQVDNYANNEQLFAPLFAEPQMINMTSGGYMQQEYNMAKSAATPAAIAIYEVNLHTTAGAISQSALDQFTPSVGAGISVANHMLMMMREHGARVQTAFSLPQYFFYRSDGKSVRLWGSVYDMGVTDRKRPQFLALQAANTAIFGDMLQTNQTGANPTWNQASMNGVQLSNANFIQSYAFSDGTNKSMVMFNLSRTTGYMVNFTGANAPTGTLQELTLTSTNLTDSNEAGNLVAPAYRTLTNFGASSTLTLPPYSMTVITWTGSSTTKPVSITNVGAASITSNSAVINWTTDRATDSTVNYGTTSGLGTKVTNASSVTAHSLSLTGLTAGTTYYYQVSSQDANGSGASSVLSFQTPSAASPITISSVATSNITGTGATITWTTSRASDSTVTYGTTSAMGQTATNASAVTAHTVTLSGLTAGTTYYYQVGSKDSNGSGLSSVLTFQTTAATSPITVSSVSVGSITSTGATVTWTTSRASDSTVNYGTASSLGQTVTNSSPVTTHTVALSGLTAGTTYYYQVASKDANGSGTSAIATFSTSAATSVSISQVAASVSGTTANVAWATNPAAMCWVEYGTSTSYGSKTAVETSAVTNHAATLSGLANGTYNYRIGAKLSSTGATTYSGNYTFVINGSTTGPQITYVGSWNISNSSATISWATDVAADTAVEYGTTSALGMVSAVNSTLAVQHQVTLTGLKDGTTYYYRARSKNSAGVTSYSSVYTFKTPDSTPPVISGISVANNGNGTATVNWTTSEPATGQAVFGKTTAYGNWTGGTLSLTTGHSFVMNGVSSGTWHVVVYSADGAGNMAVSSDYTFTIK